LWSSGHQDDLTEAEAEYVVRCIRHSFPEHVVLQFNVKNTVEEFKLHNVHVRVDVSECPGMEAVAAVPCDEVTFERPGVCFVSLRHAQGAFPTGSVSCTLHFDLEEEGMPPQPDEYQIEDCDIGAATYMRSGGPVDDEEGAWASLEGLEVTNVFSLANVRNVQDAVDAVQGSLGLHVMQGDRVQPNAKLHKQLLRGELRGGDIIMARVWYKLDSAGTAIRLCVRSPKQHAIDFLVACMG
jgi:coatomer protein complex subunit gamma